MSITWLHTVSTVTIEHFTVLGRDTQRQRKVVRPGNPVPYHLCRPFLRHLTGPVGDKRPLGKDNCMGNRPGSERADAKVAGRSVPGLITRTCSRPAGEVMISISGNILKS